MATTPAAPPRALLGLAELAIDPSVAIRRSGMEPDPWQADFVRYFGRRRRDGERARRGIVNGSRQASAKTTAIAASCAVRAVLEPGAEIVALSATQRTSNEIIRDARAFLAWILPTTDDAASEAVTHVELANGSRIGALPATSVAVRGWSAALAVIDEAAYIGDEVIEALLPALLATDGDLAVVSTPDRPSGFFHSSWQEALVNPGVWRSWHVPVSACPRVPADRVAELRRTMSPSRAARDLDAEFVEPDGSLVSAEALSAMFDQPATEGWSW